MSKDYESYSEFKKKEKARKERLFKLGFVSVLGLIVAGGLLWAGINIFKNMPAREPASKPAAPVVQQADKNAAQKLEATKANAADAIYGDAKYLIHIHKQKYKLELFEKGKAEPIKVYNVAIAKNDGDKQKPGDNTTPTSWGNAEKIPSEYKGAKPGVASSQVPFRVEEVFDSSGWTHDFHDGKGVIKGAYGPWFISIDTGWNGIGIHGTHDPKSIGTKASEGCIRLLNEDVKELRNTICKDKWGVGTRVIITED